MTNYYAVFDGDLDYIDAVLSAEEYDAEYGRVHPDYRPRCKQFESSEAAERFAVEQDKRAAEQYSA